MNRIQPFEAANILAAFFLCRPMMSITAVIHFKINFKTTFHSLLLCILICEIGCIYKDRTHKFACFSLTLILCV